MSHTRPSTKLHGWSSINTHELSIYGTKFARLAAILAESSFELINGWSYAKLFPYDDLKLTYAQSRSTNKMIGIINRHLAKVRKDLKHKSFYSYELLRKSVKMVIEVRRHHVLPESKTEPINGPSCCIETNMGAVIRQKC